MIAGDFETHLISSEHPYPKPVCLSTYNGKTEELIVGMTEMEERLSAILSKEHFIAHHAPFECGVIYDWFPALRDLLFKALNEGRIHCTKIQEQILDNKVKEPGNRYSLADLVKKYYHKDISAEKSDPKAWRLRYSELETTPLAEWPIEASRYAIDDSIWTFKIHNLQGLTDVESVRAAVYLNLMGTRGIQVDVSRAKQLRDEIYNHLESKYQRLITVGLCSRTDKSRPKKEMKKFREYILLKLKDKALYTPKKIIRTDFEALGIYHTLTQDEVFKDFIDINEYDKVITAYVSNLLNPLVRSEYEATKTTGRTSSHKSKLYPSLNIQQMPRKVENVTWDVRNCFIPKKGYKICTIDYAGLELCSTAHQLYKLYGHSNMRNVINEGKDLHSNLGSYFAKVSYEEFFARKKEHPYSYYRQLAKPINLGFPGGLGYETMRTLLLKNDIKPEFKEIYRSKNETEIKWGYIKYNKILPNLRISRVSKTEYALVQDELVGLKNKFLELYPELGQFLSAGHERFLTREFKFAKNEYGEWEQEPMYKYDIYGFTRDYCTYTAFCNGYLMQTPSAIGAKRACCSIISKYLDHPEVRPLAFIHDELLFEIKDNENMIQHSKDLANMMIDSMQTVLDTVRITTETNLMDYWSKSDGFYTETISKEPVKPRNLYVVRK